jgi:hypothetical protein
MDGCTVGDGGTVGEGVGAGVGVKFTLGSGCNFGCEIAVWIILEI